MYIRYPITFSNYSEDNKCGLLTVGSWYAMTGYGFAMVKNSKYVDTFNKKMIEYRESGILFRIHQFSLVEINSLLSR